MTKTPGLVLMARTMYTDENDYPYPTKKGVLMDKKMFLLLMLLTVSIPASVQGKSLKTVSPKNGETVSMVDQQVRKWYKRSKKTPPEYKKDHAVPSGVTLKWKKTGKKYTLLLSRNKKLSGAKKYTLTSNHITFHNLRRNQRYYWRVSGIYKGKEISSVTLSFKTSDHPRLIRISKVANVRDLGGYKVNGGRIKQGMIYRSANLDSIKESGKKTIGKLGIQTDLDLRNENEGLGGTDSPADLSYIHIPGAQYEEVIDSEKSRHQLVRECKVFAREDNYPILFHCTYGRDRTGTLAFMLEGLLGVGKKNLYKDYALTFLSSKRGSGTSDRIKRFDRLFQYMASYKDKEKPLAYNIQAFLLDYGMSEKEVNKIKEIMIVKSSSAE